MIPNSFPRTQGQLSREQYLTLILLALLQQSGGELRLTAQNLEAVDSGGSLLTDWDSKKQQLILRSGSQQLVVAQVRGAGWQTVTPQIQPPQVVQPEDKTKHRPPLTDEQLAKFMQDWQAKQRMNKWREEGAAAVAGMPQPTE